MQFFQQQLIQSYIVLTVYAVKRGYGESLSGCPASLQIFCYSLYIGVPMGSQD